MSGDPEPATSAGLTAADLEWLSLDDGEEIAWASGPDRRTLVPAFVVGIPLAIVLIGIFLIVGEYLRVTNTQYVVTNRACYRKTGIFSRDVKRIEHEKVQDISYSQSALGNYFGYGSVEISTAGGSGVEMSFKSVPEPRDVQHLISDQRKRERGRDHDRGDEGDGRPADDVLAEILTELRTIRTTLEQSAQGQRRGQDQQQQRAHQTRDRDAARTDYDEP